MLKSEKKRECPLKGKVVAGVELVATFFAYGQLSISVLSQIPGEDEGYFIVFSSLYFL